MVHYAPSRFVHARCTDIFLTSPVLLLLMFKQPLYMGNRSLYCLAALAAIASPLSAGSLIQSGELYRAFFASSTWFLMS